jgi:hypothetical protein
MYLNTECCTKMLVCNFFFPSLFYVSPDTENEHKPQRDLEDKFINKIRIWEYGKKNFMYIVLALFSMAALLYSL